MCGLDQDSGFFIRSLSIARVHEQVQVLERNAKTNLTCAISDAPKNAELNIVPWVRYTIPIGIHRCKAAKFRGKPAANGTYVWTYHGSAPCKSN